MEHLAEQPCLPSPTSGRARLDSDEALLTSSVWLRMIRGTSLQPLYMLSSATGDEFVSLGSGESCDWQVTGAGVPSCALDLRVLANCLFARARDEAEVLVDGEQLAAMWVPVAKGARLQVGSVVIEVGLSGRSRAAQSQSLSSSLGAEAALDEAADSLLARFSITGMPGPDMTSARCDVSCAATVLDPEALERSRLPWRSAGVLIAGSLMACAYGCWVLLLDYL